MLINFLPPVKQKNPHIMMLPLPYFMMELCQGYLCSTMHNVMQVGTMDFMSVPQNKAG